MDGWEANHMKLMQGKFALAMLIASSLALGGCFGPFKKKSSSGGGGGSGSEEEEVDGDEGGKGGSNKNSGETPSAPAPSTPTPPGAKDGFGCLQGVVTDGFTGQPIALSDPSKIFVLIRGTKLTANKVDGIDGQYFICDIPGEDTYPVYAFLDGYMPFESSVQITLTRAKRVAADGQAVIDEVKIADPIELTNLRLFPTGNTTRDLRVRVVHSGGGVKDAFVDLEAQAAGASGTFAFEGTFANSIGTRILPIRVMTDADGYAVFPAAKLSLGAAYKVTVHGPVVSNFAVPTVRDVVVGVSTTENVDFNSYDLNISLDEAGKDLKVVSCSTQMVPYNSAGQLKIMFNRNFKISDKENIDGSITLTAGVKGQDGTTDIALASDSSAVNLEQATVSIDKNILTITPVFTANGGPKALDFNSDLDSGVNLGNKDGEVTYNFANILLDTEESTTATGSKVALSALIAGMSPACNNKVRFFQDFD